MELNYYMKKKKILLMGLKEISKLGSPFNFLSTLVPLWVIYKENPNPPQSKTQMTMKIQRNLTIVE